MYESDSLVFGAIKLSKCFCRFHGFAEKSLLMNDVKHLIALVMKSLPAKSTSTRKQSTIRSLPGVSWRSWNTSLSFLWNIMSGCMLHNSAFGASASKRSHTFSVTVRLWLVLSVITKSILSSNSFSVYLYPTEAVNMRIVITSNSSRLSHVSVKIERVGRGRWIPSIVIGCTA